MATIGNTNVEASSGQLSNNILGTVATSAIGGTIASVTAYLTPTGSGRVAKYALYDASNSKLLGQTQEVVLDAGASWYTAAFPTSVYVPPNIEVWILGWADGSFAVTIARSSLSGGGRFQALTYTTDFPDPATTTNNNFIYSIYATYDTEVLTFGQTGNGGSSSSSSGDANLVNRSTETNSSPATDGVLESIRARLWVDSGSTVAKGLIYDSSGNLLAVGDEVTISNIAEAEITFPFSGVNAIALTAGTGYSYGVMWADPGAASINWSRQSVSSTAFKNNIDYITPQDPLGSGTVSGPVDMYVVYTESGVVDALSPNDAALTLTVDATTISQNHVLSGADETVGLHIDATTITQNHVISPQDINIGLSTDNATVTGNHTVTANDLALGLSVGATTISQIHVHSPADLSIGVRADNASITQNHVVAVQDISLALTEDTTSTVENYTVSPADIAVSLSEDGATIAQVHSLTVQDISLGLLEDATAIAQVHVIAGSDLSLALGLDNGTINTQSVITPQDLAVGLGLESAVLGQTHTLSPADLAHSLTIDATTAIQEDIIIFTDGISLGLAVEVGHILLSAFPETNLIISTVSDSFTIRASTETLTVRGVEDSLIIRGVTDELVLRSGVSATATITGTDSLAIVTDSDNLTVVV